MYYIITGENGSILQTNIERVPLKKGLLLCEKEFEKVDCKIRNKPRRQGKIILSDSNIYLCTYDDSITNRIFKNYISGITVFSKLIDHNLSNIKDSESKKTRRLKHNLINHNSNILQELYSLIPQDSFKAGKNHLDVIKKQILDNPEKASFTYLKVLKSSNLMKAEFEVYEMFDTENPYLDFFDHVIHKVLILTLNPFWLDLVQNNVNINIQPFYNKVRIDYKSISVALSHIFDNASKYTMPHSDLNISFKNSYPKVIIQIDMTSLKIEPEELDALFNEEKSGKWAKELELNGDGIGMFVVKKLVDLNNGTIEFHQNYDNKSSVFLNGVPYENNRIIMTFNGVRTEN